MKSGFFSKEGISFILSIFAGFFSCGNSSVSMDDMYLVEPVGYRDSQNAQNKYPLFVYLHPWSSPGGEKALPCLKTETERTAYPCFIYVPHSTKSTFNNKKIIGQIEALKQKYRIDTNRLYLAGHSMGGSGSYSLINDYYESKGVLFAGIIRMSGQTQTVLRDSIIGKTAIWYHIGLSDEKSRVETARKSFAFLKTHIKADGTTFHGEPAPYSQHPGITQIISKNGIDIVKYTEYDPPTGHDIGTFPFEDPKLLVWLFSQSLKNR